MRKGISEGTRTELRFLMALARERYWLVGEKDKVTGEKRGDFRCQYAQKVKL